MRKRNARPCRSRTQTGAGQRLGRANAYLSAEQPRPPTAGQPVRSAPPCQPGASRPRNVRHESARGAWARLLDHAPSHAPSQAPVPSNHREAGASAEPRGNCKVPRRTGKYRLCPPRSLAVRLRRCCRGGSQGAKPSFCLGGEVCRRKDVGGAGRTPGKVSLPLLSVRRPFEVAGPSRRTTSAATATHPVVQGTARRWPGRPLGRPCLSRPCRVGALRCRTEGTGPAGFPQSQRCRPGWPAGLTCTCRLGTACARCRARGPAKSASRMCALPSLHACPVVLSRDTRFPPGCE